MGTGLLRQWMTGGGLGAIVLAGLLSGCGGGSGGGDVISTPAPVPTAPTPTPSVSVPVPTPTPTATPAAVFQTSEYNRSDGPSFHNVLPLWQNGANGSGSTIAIVDSGIDTDSPEFAGRISPASASVAGNASIEAEDQHGTNVAMVAAAARDSTGVVGIAWNSTIQVLRADTPGSCATKVSGDEDTGCKFSNGAIAAGIDRAIAAKAQVINLSLGGDPPTSALRSAIGRAAAAGIVVVVSAGNDGNSTEAGVDPSRPDPFALGLRQSGAGNVIIVGSVDENGAFSSFSNRAGSEQQWYLTALGQRVCCVYENGVMKVTTDSNGTRFVSLFSGTSFAAPQVSGAVALLAQAFPNLTATQIVDLLLSTARDAGEAGTDGTFGRGVLDIGRAFTARGTVTLAGTSEQMPLGDTTITTGAAMGDAAARASGLGVVILDGYGRAFAYDIAASVRDAQRQARLLPALASTSRSVTMSAGPTSLAFSIDATQGAAPLALSTGEATRARVLAASVVSRISAKDKVAFGFHQGAEGLAASVRGERDDPFLIARAPAQDNGSSGYGKAALAWRHQWDDLGLTATAERERLTPGAEQSAFTDRTVSRSEDARSFALSADARYRAVQASVGLTWLAEARTILGSRFHSGLGARGADTLFADARAGWDVAPGWRASAAWRQGWTFAREHGSIARGRLSSQAFALDLQRQGLFQSEDVLGLRIAQPLRVASGSVNLLLPVDYDYATLTTTVGQRRLQLSPSGREIDAELAWRGQLLGGGALVSAYLRSQPYHIVSAPTDKGIAFSWTRAF